MLGAFQLLRQIIWGTGLAMHIITIPGYVLPRTGPSTGLLSGRPPCTRSEIPGIKRSGFCRLRASRGEAGCSAASDHRQCTVTYGPGDLVECVDSWLVFAARRRPFPVAGGNSDRSSLGHRGGDLPLRTEPSGYGECFSTTVLYALDSLLFDSCAHLVAGTELSGTRLGMDPVAGGGGAGYGVCSIPVGNPRLPPVCDSTPHVITDRPSTFPCGAGNTTSI